MLNSCFYFEIAVIFVWLAVITSSLVYGYKSVRSGAARAVSFWAGSFLIGVPLGLLASFIRHRCWAAPGDVLLTNFVFTGMVWVATVLLSMYVGAAVHYVVSKCKVAKD